VVLYLRTGIIKIIAIYIEYSPDTFGILLCTVVCIRLEINEEEPTYGKYGIMRKQFLKERRSARYQYLVLTGKLTEHLNQVDKEASEKVEMLMEQMAEQWGVTEELKMQNQIEWVRRMNNIKNVAEEMVSLEIIYA